MAFLVSIRRAARFTFARKMAFSAGRMMAPPAFSRSFTSNVGGGDDSPRGYLWAYGELLAKGRIKPVEMKEDEDAVRFRIEVPGLGKEDIKLSVENKRLTAVNLKKDSKWIDIGEFLMLDVPPFSFKATSIKADVKNGVLNIVIPKAGKIIDGAQ